MEGLGVINRSESDASAIRVDIHPSRPMPIIRTEHRNKEKCPCNKSFKSSWILDCHKCHQYWHADCMGLGGLSEKEINKFTQWSRPFCWVSPISTLDMDVHVCHVCRNTLSLQQSRGETKQSAAPPPRSTKCHPLSSSRKLPVFTLTFFSLSTFLPPQYSKCRPLECRPPPPR
jgi:hypothetical protein